MDFVTDLPPCGIAKHNAILTVVDRLTKYTKLIPCVFGAGEADAKTIADLFFTHVASVFGIPREVLYDRDPRFTSNFWKCLWKRIGTKTIFTSAYRPQTDGQTER